MFWKVGISLRNVDNAIFCNYVIAFQCEFEGSLPCKWSSWAGKGMSFISREVTFLLYKAVILQWKGIFHKCSFYLQALYSRVFDITKHHCTNILIIKPKFSIQTNWQDFRYWKKKLKSQEFYVFSRFFVFHQRISFPDSK